MKDLAEVCSLSRGMMSQSLSPSLPGGVRFFRFPLPTASSVRLAVSYPWVGRLWVYHVPRTEQNGLGPLSSPVALGVHERPHPSASARYSAFWLKPVSILGLFIVTTFSKRSHMLTMSFTLAPYPLLMLADTHISLRFDEQSDD